LALTPQNNDAFFREVDDEVRRERVATIARRYGVIVGGIVILALIALAAVLVWRSHAETVAGERGEQFTAAMSSLTAGNSVAANKGLDPLIDENAKGYAPMARLLKADMLVQQGKDKEGVVAFQKVADDSDVPQPLRDLALVRATALGFDGLAPQEAINRLKPLAVPGGAWFGSAGEMTAIAYMQLNQPQKAGPLFAQIARDKTVPQTIQQRAKQLAADLGIDVVQPADSARP
jgi:hypothetical protein